MTEKEKNFNTAEFNVSTTQVLLARGGFRPKNVEKKLCGLCNSPYKNGKCTNPCCKNYYVH